MELAHLSLLAILLYHKRATIQDTVTDRLRNGMALPAHTAVRFMLGQATRVAWEKKK